MDDKCWYYGSEEEKQGPHSRDELADLVKRGELAEDARVFSESSGEWHSLDEAFKAAGTLDVPVTMRKEKKEEIVKEGDETQARPWTRFFARGTDYILFTFVLSLLLGLIGVPFFIASPIVAYIVAVFLWCFVEAACIAGWATTPGKWILGVSVHKVGGRKLSYGEALSRALSVWLLGMAAGLPLVMIVTWIVACVKLSNQKVTSWDARGEIAVSHKKLNWFRIVITIAIYVCFGALLIIYGFPH